MGETVWLGLRENEVRALRDIKALERERRLELREVQRNENRVRDLGFVISEIYRGRYCSNFMLSLNGSGRVQVRAGFLLNPGPASGFFIKPKPDPILYRVG